MLTGLLAGVPPVIFTARAADQSGVVAPGTAEAAGAAGYKSQSCQLTADSAGSSLSCQGCS